MRRYSVTACGKTVLFEALDDKYAFEAAADILDRDAFLSCGDEQIYRIDGPDGPITGNHRTMGDLRSS